MNEIDFILKLEKIYWLYDSDTDDEIDICGHMDIKFIVKGVDIINDSPTGWNVNYSSVMLLSSTFEDIIDNNEYFIICGCNIMPMCHQNINYIVQHHDELVTLSNFKNGYFQNDELFKDLTITLPWKEYAKQIFDLTAATLDFLPENHKSKDEWESQMYKELRDKHVILSELLRKKLKEI